MFASRSHRWVAPLLAVFLTGSALAAELPLHSPLRILIVSDEVNPHGLSPAELTQPGDLSIALQQSGANLNVEVVTEVATNSIEQATALLNVPYGSDASYDLLIYFAHRIPNNGVNDQLRQDAFDVAVESFLTAGGGVVSFHHGVYLTGGKGEIVDLLGASATGNVPFDAINGQQVIATAPDEWVVCNGVEYPNAVLYSDPARGVPAATYPFFSNVPDERYPQMEYAPSALGNVVTLFGSNYVDNGATHLLGWIHQRPGWLGRVVGYQPGEYQPIALDDPEQNNFQILVNAILFAAREVPDDGIKLWLDKSAGEPLLQWSACGNPVDLYRSTDATSAGDAANQLVQTTDSSWIDSAAPQVAFYLVLPGS